MTCNITAVNDTVKLSYRVLIDCSVISYGNLQSKYDLQQIFTVNISNTTLDINNSGINTTLRTNLSSPTVKLNNGNAPYFINYLSTNYITVRYTNYSNLPAHIRFTYNGGDNTLCGYGSIDSFAYSIDNINFTNYSQNTIANIIIPPNDTLFIRQRVIETNCIDSFCKNTCILQWQCDYDTGLGNLFCDACVQQEVLEYFVQSNDLPKVVITEISPALNDTQDFSCFNDTANMVNWEYIVVHDAASVGATDTLTVTLSWNGLPNNTYTIDGAGLVEIPQSSIVITRTGSSLVVDTFLSTSAQLCNNYIPDPLRWLTIKAADFTMGDTLRIKFKTFRCAEENDAILLNTPKFLNHWRLDAIPLSICNTAFITAKKLSSELFVGNWNIDQQLQMFPTTTQLTVPPFQKFGDTLALQVDVRKFVNQNKAGMFQYLGCTQKFTDTACNASGIWRVKVTLGTGLRIQQPWMVHLYKDSIVTVTIYPDYYNDDVNDTLCEAGSYYFYFHFSDTIKMMMEQGTLALTVQACCDSLMAEPVHIDIASYIMPDATGSCNGALYPTTNHDTLPTFNTGQAFIPLASATHNIHVHCPGCLAPGVIADRYRLSRTSFGLQDSNNDGIADDSLLQVAPGNSYYANHSKSIARNNSSVGDTLRDYVTLHLQDGDPTLGGYNYAQMKTYGAILNYLNIGVTIPSAFDTLNLMPDGYDFYIDIDTTAAPCIDCNKFEVSANFKTILHIFVPTANMATYMQMITTQNKFYYTFSALDTSAQYILNPSYIIYTDGSFSGFDVNQRYRLSTRYKECGTWPVKDVPQLADVMRKKEIDVQTWMSSLPKDSNAFTNFAQAPADTNALHVAGWSFLPLAPNTDTVNQAFPDTFLFFCEFTGATHYFFSQDIWMGGVGYKSNNSNCGIDLEIKTTHRTAGNVLDIYPFEYRPPALNNKEVKFYVPPSYAPVAIAHYYNSYIGGLSTYHTPFSLPTAVNGSITILYNTLLPPACWSTNDYNGTTFADSLPYVKDGLYYNTIIVNFVPNTCDSKTLFSTDTCVQLITDTATLDSMNNSFCNYQDTLHSVQKEFSHTSKANLQVVITPPSQNVYTHRICWNMIIKNPYDTIDSIQGATTTYLYTHAAPNVYIAVPNVSWLSNWTFTPNIGSPISSIGNYYIPVNNLLAINGIIEGQLCADYNTCQDSTAFNIYAGYECAQYPDTPFILANACHTANQQVVITDNNTSLTTDGKTPAVNYGLCKPFIKTMNVYRSGNGEVYIDSVMINNLPTEFTVNNVWITSPTNTTDSVILAPTTVWQHWHIDSLALATLGDSTGTLTGNSQGLIVHIEMEAHCDIYNGNSPHTIIVLGRNFCNDLLTDSTGGSLFVWDSTSNCSDCFTITKTANTQSINAYDTITYTVIVTANNGSAQTVIVSDLFPINFTIVGTNPFPDTITLAPQGSQTYTVQGYFYASNDCANTFNVASLMHNADTLKDSVCVQVQPTCYTPNMIYLPDQTELINIGSTFNNDTFYVAGVLLIENMTATFNNCVIYTAAGANIIINTAQVYLNSSYIIACDTMWQGITMLDDAWIYTDTTHIEDAHIAIDFVGNGGGFKIQDSYMINNVTSINVPPSASCNTHNIYGYVAGTKFGLYKTKFPKDYIGQLAHGIKPFTGISMVDMIFTLGDNTAAKNTFHNMNSGIVACQSDIKIYNSTFDNVAEDNFYLHTWRGTAMVSLSGFCGLPGKMVVHPNLIDTLVFNSFRGSYADNSNFTLTGNKLWKVNTGVYATNCKGVGMTTMINSNNIIASHHGIYFIDNAGYGKLTAAGNTIKITGNVGLIGEAIAILEKKIEEDVAWTPYYNINTNNINVQQGADGIIANYVYQPQITYNEILSNTTGANQLIDGIAIDGCYEALVSCNNVKGNTVTDTLHTAIAVRISTGTQVICNTVDSTGYGMFFGGICLGTMYRGNSMYHHFNSLRLNNVAVIDTQAHAGNTWNTKNIVMNGNWDAVNYNALTLNDLFASLFSVNQNSPSQFFPQTPIVSPNNVGWFKLEQTGSEYSCSSALLCAAAIINDNGSLQLINLIINDSNITSEFLAESRTIAQDVQFTAFMRNNGLTNSNTAYLVWVALKQNLPTGFLYEVQNDLMAAKTFDTAMIHNLVDNDSLIAVYVDSIYILDATIQGDTTYLYRTKRANLIQEIIQLKNANASLLQNFYNNVTAPNLDNAANRNDFASDGEIPHSNEKILNDVELNLLEGGIESIRPRTDEIKSIAQQCPYIGGTPVFKARSYLAMLGDTTQFQDASICAMEGIFRQAQNNIANADLQFLIQPNPAQNYVDVMLNNKLEGICSISIVDAIGKNIYSKTFDCKTRILKIDTSKFVNGVYNIGISINGNVIKNEKLIIVR